MWWTNTKRIIRSGFMNFWRNSFVSFSAMLMMFVTLFVLGSIIFSGVILESTLNQIKNKVDINIYFVTDAPEEKILEMKKSIEALPEVKSVEYISRKEALTRFKARHENDQLTLQAIEELGDNPLGASLSVRAKDTSQYESIANFLEGETALSSSSEDNAPMIEKINYFQNKVAINKLTKIIKSTETFGLILTIILVIASIIITFNTIRLAIFTSRDEISVMRLVGASNAYIQGPFVFEGVMYGLASGILTLLLFYPVTLWLSPVAKNFFGEVDLFGYYVNNFNQLFLIIVGSGIVLGVVSSYLAVKRYLKA